MNGQHLLEDRIGVTGAAGFIGSHLVRGLHFEVIAQDRNVSDTTSDQFDLLDAEACYRWVAERNIGTVIHCAAQVGRVFGEDDISTTIDLNAKVSANVARACAAAGAKLVYISTSEVYGDQDGRECSETTPCVLPNNLYGVSKGWGEEVSMLYARQGLKICRLSMPYGPGVPPGRGRRALDTMLWQAHHRMPIIVHRGSERSWCYISDIVAAIDRIVHKGTPGIYNVGRDDDPRSMLAIAERACEIAGAPYDLIEVVDAPANQTVVKRLATDKVRALGWAPQVSLDEGMRAVYEWVRGFDRDGVPCSSR